jgi:acyl-coenzyme A synthetase/AMP-(fatty) acid ligase
MAVDWLLDRFRRHHDEEAVVWHDRTSRYDDLLARVDVAGGFLAEAGVRPGEPILLDADFSPGSIAMLIAAIANRNIVVPAASHVVNLDRDERARIAQARFGVSVTAADEYQMRSFGFEVSHPLLAGLREKGHAGLVLFTSGSTGQPKAAVHDLDLLLHKFTVERHKQRMISFLLFDHIGGFNTLMYTIANGGCVITVEGRDVASVCAAIEKHRAEVLPTSPTFLNLLLMSGEQERHDLSSLKIINYATEVMPETTLRKLSLLFPGVELRQSYGLSELGILRSKSRASDSAWVKVGGEDYETRVVNGVLHIKARSSMLGYLNAPSPFDEDGWFNTQDDVEVDGEWLRFKGRKSDIINVGGEKVYPAEVESLILEVDNIADATVTREPHPITGNIVVAEVRLRQPEDLREVSRRIRAHCFSKLPSFKVPVKIRLQDTARISERAKKLRDPALPSSDPRPEESR